MQKPKSVLIFFSLAIVLSARVRATALLSPGEDLAKALAKHEMITLQPGKHSITEPLLVKQDRSIIFENGAELVASLPTLIRQQGGKLILESKGKAGRLRNNAGAGERGFLSDKRNSIIDLNEISADNQETVLILRNMELYGFNGVDGYLRKQGVKTGPAKVEIEGCYFDCREKALGFIFDSLGELRLENSSFENCDEALMANCPLPGGAIVRGNIIRNFGRRAMMLGKAGQIADGCTTHLPNAIVQDNQLLGGGQRATLADSYIFGILVYGHNVTVMGNIVRDVNRGRPVPGELGHVLTDFEGKEHGGIRIDSKERSNRRLAGAAIYLKANRALVQGNICSNSGWRSAIEIKTGGKEHFVMVSNNVVDGRALAQDDSFGFECNSGRSLWSGNLVYDMPNQAFVVRSGYENTFMNNLIVNAKVGFALSGPVPGQDELIQGNRFINVQHPVAVTGNMRPGSGPDLILPGPALLHGDETLPNPEKQWLGRMMLREDKMYLCVEIKNGEFRWMEMSGTMLAVRKFRETGPELALNPDQSAPGPLGVEALDNPLHRGWQMSMLSSNEKKLEPGDGHVSYDQEDFQSGSQSLKVAFKEVSGNWRLSQNLTLPAGKRYRASAVLKGEEPLNLRLFVQCGAKTYQKRANDQPGWQTLSLDFETPPNSGSVLLRVWSSKTNAGKAAWLDSVSIKELLMEEFDEMGNLIQKPEKLWIAKGDNLLLNSDFARLSQTVSQAGAHEPPEKWSLALSPNQKELPGNKARYVFLDRQRACLELGFAESGGNLLFSQNLPLPGARRYRLSMRMQSEQPQQVTLGAKGADQRHQASRVECNTDWQVYSFDFSTPATEGTSNIRLWVNNLPEKQLIRISEASLVELQEQVEQPNEKEQ